MAPDIDDPDEGGPGVPTTSWGSLLGADDIGDLDDDVGASSSKRRSNNLGAPSSSSSLDSKRKKTDEIRISLPNAPTDSEHPLLNPKMEKPQKLPSAKQGGGNGGGRGRPRLNDDSGGSSRKRKEKY